MGIFVKIDQAIRVSDGHVVSIYDNDIVRGNPLFYVCRSCSSPVMPRMGDINAWHFAHIHSHLTDKAIDCCQYYEQYVSSVKLSGGAVSSSASFSPATSSLRPLRDFELAAIKSLSQPSAPPPSAFRCVMCNVTFSGERFCPKCGKHIYIADYFPFLSDTNQSDG